MYEDFSKNVTEDRTLHKFWQLHRTMNGNNAQAQIPDFRRENDVWVRTPEEKVPRSSKDSCVRLIKAMKRKDQH